MALASYTDLKTAIGNWLNRDDLADFLDDFIDLAEARMHRDLRIRPMQKRSQASTVSGTAAVALPCDFLESKSIYLDGDPKQPLAYVSTFHKDGTYGGSQTGKPKMWSIVGNEILLAPTPDAAYTLEIAYWGKFDALSASNTTNWLLTNAPDCYLFGSLMEATPFIKDEVRAPYWASRYQDAISNLQLSHADSGSSGMTIRAVV